MAKRKKDPRECKTLKEAAMNENGTYDGARMFSWITGLPLSDVKKIAEDIVAGRPSMPNGEAR